ncbi:efflux RND transporter periplasmic adaptor subunit [Chryseobacterium kimseyorum]|nr:efflux RND transporter periplasmic adaptor subunit [Chryseobacterium kimseyorum]
MELPVSKVEQGNGLVSKEYPASIEGVTDVEIRPQVSGYLQKVYVDEGAYVRAGQPLFQIDSRMYAEQYNTAKAGVAVAKANLANLNIDLKRRRELVKESIVSNIQLQQAQAAYDGAKASLTQAEAAAQSARINLEFCTIKAPVSGYLSRINYRLGSLISPSGVDPITVLSDSHEVNVYFSMSENDFLTFQNSQVGSTIQEKIKKAPMVGLQIADGHLYEEKGRIDAVEGQFNSNTGSVTFRAKFNNPKNIIRGGNTGKIVIDQHFDNVIMVPIASTSNIQDKVYIFTLNKNNKAVQKAIEISGKSGTNYMVSGGIKAGESYIVSGFERLQPGMSVVPKSANQQAIKTQTKAAAGKG